jgi:hypothetical protein
MSYNEFAEEAIYACGEKMAKLAINGGEPIRKNLLPADNENIIKYNIIFINNLLIHKRKYINIENCELKYETDVRWKVTKDRIEQMNNAFKEICNN